MNEPDPETIIEKTFTFEDDEDTQSLTVVIPEVLDPQYGMYVWPCAVVLSQYVWMTREKIQHKTVVELGAGVSLPGVVAAKCGAHVILSDSAELPFCLNNCRRSCDVNNLPTIPVMGLTWGQLSPELLSLPPVDIILASDVFYEPEDFEDVLVTICFLVRKNPCAQFWTTYQERRYFEECRAVKSSGVLLTTIGVQEPQFGYKHSSKYLSVFNQTDQRNVHSADWSIDALLHKWNLKCINVPLETFDANKNHLAGSTLPGDHTVQMMIITAREKF